MKYECYLLDDISMSYDSLRLYYVINDIFMLIEILI